MPHEKTLTVYNYNELSQPIKDKVIQKLSDINVGGDFWYDYIVQNFIDYDLKQIGIIVKEEVKDGKKIPSYRNFSFDLDYNNRHISFDNGYIEDIKKFLQFCKVDTRTKRAKELINNYGLAIVENRNNWSGDYNTVESNENVEKDLTECLQRKLGELFNQLKNAYEAETSREAIEDTIRNNEYEFDEYGNIR